MIVVVIGVIIWLFVMFIIVALMVGAHRANARADKRAAKSIRDVEESRQQLVAARHRGRTPLK